LVSDFLSFAKLILATKDSNVHPFNIESPATNYRLSLKRMKVINTSWTMQESALTKLRFMVGETKTKQQNNNKNTQ
jgi:hypothetical protein